MNKLIYVSIEFVGAFLLIYLLYRLFIIKNKKDKTKKETKKSSKKVAKIIKKTTDKKTPVELDLFIRLNNIDEKTIDKKKVMNRLALLNAFDIALILVLTEVTEVIALKAVIALVAIFVVLLATYKLYGLKFKKKEVAKEDVRS